MTHLCLMRQVGDHNTELKTGDYVLVSKVSM